MQRALSERERQGNSCRRLDGEQVMLLGGRHLCKMSNVKTRPLNTVGQAEIKGLRY